MDEVTQPLPFRAWEQIQKEVISDLKREKTVFFKRDMEVYMIDLSREICKPVLKLDLQHMA